MTVQRLDRALKNCARSKGNAPGLPALQEAGGTGGRLSFVGREVRLEPGRIRLPKIGWLRVRGMALPPGADMKQVAVTQEPNGWHVSIQFEGAPKAYAEPTLPMVGIDGGLAHLATLSDGMRIAHSRWRGRPPSASGG